MIDFKIHYDIDKQASLDKLDELQAQGIVMDIAKGILYKDLQDEKERVDEIIKNKSGTPLKFNDSRRE